MAAKSSGPPVSGSHSASVTDVNGHVQLLMEMPKILSPHTCTSSVLPKPAIGPTQ